jgi:citrate lyase beta subunit
MNATLMKSIVESAAFLSLSGDDAVQPDAAVAQLEQLAATLKEMSQEDRQTFVRYINDLAQQERRAGKDKERIAFLETLPENLGIE